MAPFVSSAQRKWAFKTKQPWAKEWADKTKGKLPNHVKKVKVVKKKKK